MEDMSKFHTVRGYQLLAQNKNQLTSAMEDYLEMIYRCSLAEGYMRINTISEQLNVAAPSATKMVQKLTKLGFLDYKKYGIIFLTENGREVGRFLLERHNIIELFLKNLCVHQDLLTQTELIEHNISASTLAKINLFNKFIAQNPSLLEKFRLFIRQNPDLSV